MLSVKHCREILKQNGVSYTDSEVQTIRSTLYALGEIDYNFYKDKNKYCEKS